MLLNSLKQLNWLDIFVLMLIFRVCYIALKTGFLVEVFKFAGTIVAMCVSMRYYAGFSAGVSRILPFLQDVPVKLLELSVFIILASGTYLLFVFLRNLTNNLFKIEAASGLNKWGGLVLGSLRSLLFASLILFTLVISGSRYLKESIKNSYLGIKALSVSTNVYPWIWNNLLYRFSDTENKNKAVLDAEKELAK